MANHFDKFLTVEDKEHIKVVNYIKDKLPEVLAFHVPSEGKKSPFERYKHNLFGNLKGLPDFVFVQPKYKSNQSREIIYFGLFIELKSPEHKRVILKGKKAGSIVNTKGKLSKEQKEILDKLNQLKYKAVCCFGAEEAIKVIDDYFKDFYELKKLLNKRKI